MVSEVGLLPAVVQRRRRGGEEGRGAVVGVVQVVVRLQCGVDAAARLVWPHQRGVGPHQRGGAVQPAGTTPQHGHLLAGLQRLGHAAQVLRDVHHAVEVVRLGAQVAVVEQVPVATRATAFRPVLLNSRT